MLKVFSSFIIACFFISCSTQNPNTNTNNNSSALQSVTVCTQVWANKNLAVSCYRNGDIIPEVRDANSWGALTTGAWCWYNNDSANYWQYGKLYNWYAVNDPRGLALTGWHVPTSNEWITLQNCLGGSSLAGGAMKETGVLHWLSPNTGATNSSGITALPAGSRGVNGSFNAIGMSGCWWSSTETNTTASWYRAIYNSSAELYESYSDKKGGLSVLLIKD